jgi:hypothetical protein
MIFMKISLSARNMKLHWTRPPGAYDAAMMRIETLGAQYGFRLLSRSRAAGHPAVKLDGTHIRF